MQAREGYSIVRDRTRPVITHMIFKYHDLGMSPQKICSLKDRWAGTREGRAFQQKDGARGGRAGVTVLPFGAPMAKEQVEVVGAW